MTLMYMLDDAADVAHALPALMAAPLVGLDTETLGLDPLSHELRLIQLATPDAVYVLDTWHADARLLAPLFTGAGPVLAGHNLAFDLRFLYKAGLPIPAGARLFDTMLAAQLLGAGTQDGYLNRCGLAAVAERALGVTLDKSLQASAWSGALTDDQLRYAARDAAILPVLATRLHDDLDAAGLLRVADLEMRCLPAVAWLELTGAPFDGAAWRSLSDAALTEQLTVEQQLTDMAGKVDLFGQGTVNWSSPAQIAALLRTRGHDIEHTDERTLHRLVAAGEPLAPLLLQYRDASKRARTYGIEFMTHAHKATGRIHAGYLQLGSVAGRMSCQRPNLQQVPRQRAYRACFRPGPGRVFVQADFSQIELRLAAQIAGDAAMLGAFGRGEDLHTVTARTVLSKTDVSKDDRQAAKAINFGLLYGMGAETLRSHAAQNYGVHLSAEEAIAVRGRFFSTYKGLRAWHVKQGNGAGETRTVLGRRRLAVSKYTERLNTPVQGSGADGLKAALALLWENRDQAPSAVPVLCVHDEIVVECDRKQAEQTRAWLVDCMMRGMQTVLHAVPVEVAATIAADWAGTPVDEAAER